MCSRECCRFEYWKRRIQICSYEFEYMSMATRTTLYTYVASDGTLTELCKWTTTTAWPFASCERCGCEFVWVYVYVYVCGSVKWKWTCQSDFVINVQLIPSSCSSCCCLLSPNFAQNVNERTTERFLFFAPAWEMRMVCGQIFGACLCLPSLPASLPILPTSLAFPLLFVCLIVFDNLTEIFFCRKQQQQQLSNRYNWTEYSIEIFRWGKLKLKTRIAATSWQTWTFNQFQLNSLAQHRMVSVKFPNFRVHSIRAGATDAACMMRESENGHIYHDCTVHNHVG